MTRFSEGRACPNCDYWLLPVNARFHCPECGIEFDADSRVFVGCWDYKPATRRLFISMIYSLTAIGILIACLVLIKAIRLASPMHSILALAAIVALPSCCLNNSPQLGKCLTPHA